MVAVFTFRWAILFGELVLREQLVSASYFRNQKFLITFTIIIHLQPSLFRSCNITRQVSPTHIRPFPFLFFFWATVLFGRPLRIEANYFKPSWNQSSDQNWKTVSVWTIISCQDLTLSHIHSSFRNCRAGMAFCVWDTHKYIHCVPAIEFWFLCQVIISRPASPKRTYEIDIPHNIWGRKLGRLSSSVGSHSLRHTRISVCWEDS